MEHKSSRPLIRPQVNLNKQTVTLCSILICMLYLKLVYLKAIILSSV